MALLMTIFSSALGPSRRPLTLPQNFVAKRELISAYFAQNSALFGGGKEGVPSFINASEKVPTINKLFGTLLLW